MEIEKAQSRLKEILKSDKNDEHKKMVIYDILNRITIKCAKEISADLKYSINEIYDAYNHRLDFFDRIIIQNQIVRLPDIYFSNKKKTRIYESDNKISFNEFSKVFSKLNDINHNRNDNWLSEIVNSLNELDEKNWLKVIKSKNRFPNSPNNTIKDDIKTIEDDIYEYIREYWRNEKLQDIIPILTKIYKILINRDCKIAVLGEYNHTHKYIKLYMNNIKQNAEKYNISLENAILSTFAHELFHFLHMSIMDINDCPDQFTYKTSVVKESLASYYQYKFCKDTLEDENAYNSIEKSWTFRSMQIWPYAGARYIKEIYIFNNIFDESISNNIDEAYKKLETCRYIYEEMLKRIS